MLVRILSLLILPLLLVACNANPSQSFDGGTQAEPAQSSEVQAAPLKDTSSSDEGVLAEIKADEQEAKQEQAATEQEIQHREATFEQRLALDKPVGTTVCTWQNSVGVVKQVEPDRIQVAVQGRAMSATNGAFFSDTANHPKLTEQEGNVWTDGSDWAVCDVTL